MVTKAELKKAVKEVEKSDRKKTDQPSNKLSTKERMNRIVEGSDAGYHLK